MRRNHNDDPPMTPGERWTALIFLVVFLGLFAGETFTNFQPVKLAGLLIAVFWMPLMILHEFGHALMAWLLGWRVVQGVLGMGKLLGTFHVNGTPFEVRLILTTGFVSIRPRRIRLPQVESALIYFAGPGIELLLVAVIAGVVGLDTLLTHTQDYGMIALQSLCVAALMGAVLNLLPFTSAQAGSEVSASDGMGILRSFVTPTEHYARMIDGADSRSPWDDDS